MKNFLVNIFLFLGFIFFIIFLFINYWSINLDVFKNNDILKISNIDLRGKNIEKIVEYSIKNNIKKLILISKNTFNYSNFFYEEDYIFDVLEIRTDNFFIWDFQRQYSFLLKKYDDYIESIGDNGLIDCNDKSFCCDDKNIEYSYSIVKKTKDLPLKKSIENLRKKYKKIIIKDKENNYIITKGELYTNKKELKFNITKVKGECMSNLSVN